MHLNLRPDAQSKTTLLYTPVAVCSSNTSFCLSYVPQIPFPSFLLTLSPYTLEHIPVVKSALQGGSLGQHQCRRWTEQYSSAAGSGKPEKTSSHFILIFFLAFRSLHAIVQGCLSSDTGGQRSPLHRNHPAPSPRCTVTMIHHSHESLSLGLDTAVTHMVANMHKYACRQTHTFIPGSSVFYLKTTAQER